MNLCIEYGQEGDLYLMTLRLEETVWPPEEADTPPSEDLATQALGLNLLTPATQSPAGFSLLPTPLVAQEGDAPGLNEQTYRFTSREKMQQAHNLLVAALQHRLKQWETNRLPPNEVIELE